MMGRGDNMAVVVVKDLFSCSNVDGLVGEH